MFRRSVDAAVSFSSGATTMPSHVRLASKRSIHASSAAVGPIFFDRRVIFGLGDRIANQINVNRPSRKRGSSAGGTRIGADHRRLLREPVADRAIVV